jgi:hypothetical protein
MHYTNYHHINHNPVERARKKSLYIVVVAKATTQVGKPPRLLTYLCHICGIVKHNLINCQKFDKMQTMFKDKGGKITKNKHIVEVKMVNALVNMVDVHITIQSKVIEK